MQGEEVWKWVATIADARLCNVMRRSIDRSSLRSRHSCLADSSGHTYIHTYVHAQLSSLYRPKFLEDNWSILLHLQVLPVIVSFQLNFVVDFSVNSSQFHTIPKAWSFIIPYILIHTSHRLWMFCEFRTSFPIVRIWCRILQFFQFYFYHSEYLKILECTWMTLLACNEKKS